jgi:hypothetical protein
VCVTCGQALDPRSRSSSGARPPRSPDLATLFQRPCAGTDSSGPSDGSDGAKPLGFGSGRDGPKLPSIGGWGNDAKAALAGSCSGGGEKSLKAGDAVSAGAFTFQPPLASNSYHNLLLANGMQPTPQAAAESSSPRAMLHALSAEHPGSQLRRWTSNSSSDGSTAAACAKEARPLPAAASAAEVEMVEADGVSAGTKAHAADSDGLRVPDVVSKWFKSTLFHKGEEARPAAGSNKQTHEGGQLDGQAGAFADNMPLECTRKPRALDMERKDSANFTNSLPLESVLLPRHGDLDKKGSGFLDGVALDSVRRPMGGSIDSGTSGFLEAVPLEYTRKPRSSALGSKGSGVADAASLERARKPMGGGAAESSGSSSADSIPFESTCKPTEPGADTQSSSLADTARLEGARKIAASSAGTSEGGFVDRVPLESTRKPRGGGAEARSGGFVDAMPLESTRKPAGGQAVSEGGSFADCIPLESLSRQR